ncbi:hypothetical protein TA5114_02051 [Cognatishimia activa]|uniref:Uncharacterized protein n=1 Tax=Cognatishimia activa TaxID=1715691 RepID=A0A0P1IRM1_9RHOB|nr:hypothetical protein TA5113_01974 [Cognatishimia activa]CUK26242.1 hypothetical protein TA5114_02051 [Cognatishimia activa]
MLVGPTVNLVRVLILERVLSAAARMNDRFSLSTAALRFTRVQHFPRCVRSQQKNRIHRMGSFGTFAAFFTKVRFVCFAAES